MSIYKFMAGYVETDDLVEGDDFDPHVHRIIPKPTSYLDTMTHLLKGSIGAGILAMPHATQRLGIIYSSIALTAVGVFATFCIQLLIYSQYRLCKRHRRGYLAYSKSMYFALKDGPECLQCMSRALYWAVELMLIVWQLGICTIFLVFVAANLQQVCMYWNIKVDLRMLLLILLLPTILFNLIKDLKMLAPMSFASNVITFMGLMLVTFYLIDEDVNLTPDKLQLKSWQEIPNFIGTALFALEAVGVVLALEYNMANPKQFVGICGLFNIGMIIVISLYLIVGVFGYLKYGDHIRSSITLNLPQKEKKAITAKILFAVAIFLSFPLQNFVAYSLLYRRIKKKYKDEHFPLWIDYLIRLLLVLSPWGLAIGVPRLGPFISLFGALCLSLLAMVFPALMHLCLCYKEPSGYGPMRWKLLGDMLIIFLGILILISGVCASLAEIAQESKAAQHVKSFELEINDHKFII